MGGKRDTRAKRRADGPEGDAGATPVRAAGRGRVGTRGDRRRGRAGMIAAVAVVAVGVVAVAVLMVAPAVVDAQRNGVADVDLAEPSAEALELHDRLTIVDMHSDTLLWKRDPLKRANRGHMDLPRLREGNVALQVFSSVTKSPRGQNNDNNTDETDNITALAIAQLQPRETWNSLFERSMYHAGRMQRAVDSSDGGMRAIRTRGDVEDLLAAREAGEDVVGALFSVEGLHNLEGEPGNLTELYDAGMRMAGFVHFFDNEVAGSMHGVDREGLTPMGREVLAEMQELGIIVDLAHASNDTIDDVLAEVDVPVVYSHGGVRATCDNNRNLSDEQIRGIADTGGVIGVGYWEDAVCGLTPEAVVDAIDHVVQVGGIDAAALGSDFDGSVETGWDTSEIAVITQELMNRGYSEEDIAKIMGGNTLRALMEVLPE